MIFGKPPQRHNSIDSSSLSENRCRVITSWHPSHLDDNMPCITSTLQSRHLYNDCFLMYTWTTEKVSYLYLFSSLSLSLIKQKNGRVRISTKKYFNLRYILGRKTIWVHSSLNLLLICLLKLAEVSLEFLGPYLSMSSIFRIHKQVNKNKMKQHK